MVAHYSMLIIPLILALSTAAPSKQEQENQVSFLNTFSFFKRCPFCVYAVFTCFQASWVQDMFASKRTLPEDASTFFAVRGKKSTLLKPNSLFGAIAGKRSLKPNSIFGSYGKRPTMVFEKRAMKPNSLFMQMPGKKSMKPNSLFQMGKRSMKPNSLFQMGKRSMKPNSLFQMGKRSMKPNSLFQMGSRSMKPNSLFQMGKRGGFYGWGSPSGHLGVFGPYQSIEGEEPEYLDVEDDYEDEAEENEIEEVKRGRAEYWARQRGDEARAKKDSNFWAAR